MCAYEYPEPRSAVSRLEGVLAWLGGGHWHELGERHERSTHAIAGVVVVLGAVLAGIVTSLAVDARWPVPAIVVVALAVGLLVGAVTRATASGPTGGWPGVLGRGAVAVAVGIVVAELAALLLFSGSIDRRIDEQAARNAGSVPAVARASAAVDRTRETRIALDNAVDQARARRDEALVVARCEYHPTPACPQTRITGVPGAGPETRTANELLADTQRELDHVVAVRDHQAPELDAKIFAAEQTLVAARATVVANADHGLGARWVALHSLDGGALMLRLLTIALFTLVYLLPLILRLWRGETTHDRHAAARAERDRAELEADTAIAVKRAEVRQAAETMWADQQLAAARLAVEAQTQIDRAQQSRRVTEALDGPVRASSQRTVEAREEPREEDLYLPIAAEAEAASRATAQLPAGDRVDVPENLPAPVEPGNPAQPRERGTQPFPAMPDLTRAAARWMRPLVPPFVARMIDTTTHPLRAARQVYEEVEEIAFSFKHTRKVTVGSESESIGSSTDVRRIESSCDDRLGANEELSSLECAVPEDPDLSLEPTGRQRRAELMERDGPPELRSPDGPRQLPPAAQ